MLHESDRNVQPDGFLHFFAIDWYWPHCISKFMLAGKCPYQTDDALRSSVFNQ